MQNLAGYFYLRNVTNITKGEIHILLYTLYICKMQIKTFNPEIPS